MDHSRKVHALQLAARALKPEFDKYKAGQWCYAGSRDAYIAVLKALDGGKGGILRLQNGLNAFTPDNVQQCQSWPCWLFYAAFQLRDVTN